MSNGRASTPELRGIASRAARRDGTLAYEFLEPRGALRRGAMVLKVADGMKGTGLGFYPKAPKDNPPF